MSTEIGRSPRQKNEWLNLVPAALWWSLSACSPPPPSSQPPAANPKLADEEMFLFSEAFTTVQQSAVFVSAKANKYDLIQEALKAYLARQDPFSDYLSRKEYQQFKRKMNNEYVGIGVEIDRLADGSVVCFPYPDSPAARNGLMAGDQLTHVNGRSIASETLVSIGAMASGLIGTKISLSIRRDGNILEVYVPVAPTTVQETTLDWLEKLPVVKLRAFSRTTTTELTAKLKSLRPGNAVVLDLRGNRGGDFYAAIDAAKLFLDAERIIVSVRDRNGVATMKSNRHGAFAGLPLFIWQDAATASAAEVFTAALVQNQRAKSIGPRSYGKGTKQDVIELSDGSALLLTTGYLLTPNGSVYNKLGIEPSVPLAQPYSATKLYVEAVKRLMGIKGIASAG